MKGVSDFLKLYDEVYVFSNVVKKNNDIIFFKKNNKKILFVIFNHTVINKIPEDIDVLWVHRQYENTDKYYGEDECLLTNNKVFHLFIKNDLTLFFIDNIMIKSKLDIMNNYFINRYPIGSKVFSIQHKKTKIDSPSTGFLLLSLLNELKGVSVFAVGFGQFSQGYLGHAWSYERRSYMKMNINFLRLNLRKDRFLIVRAIIPDFLVRFILKRF